MFKILPALLFILFTINLQAQPTSAADKKLKSEIQKTIKYLADDKLEGRRTGTPGEKLAFQYIIKQFKKAGIAAMGTETGNYLQPFPVQEGKAMAEENYLQIDGISLTLNQDYFPLPYSANSNSENSGHAMQIVQYIDAGNLEEENRSNPHFDEIATVKDKIAGYIKNGTNLILIHGGKDFTGTFDAQDKTPVFTEPVIYITEKGFAKIKDKRATLKNVKYAANLQQKESTGHNVVGFINNNAPYTIVLGAHYDHLGYGQDHNSLYTGSKPMIHNGADDNASGTAALIALGKWLKKSGLKTYNYILVSFSGEELGLFGSKYFTDHSPVKMNDINFMINMDMVGRLNDSTKGLAIGGYGTAAEWRDIVKEKDDFFHVKLDSSGSGPSDHTSFYRKDIPVLFFFTGTHKDYHKPSDDEDKINYEGEMHVVKYIENLLTYMNSKPKIAFLKTHEPNVGISSFKVSLGIMPDYTFSGSGVRVDGVTEGRTAEKAGIKTGDVIIKLGAYTFTDMMSYMGALNKFNKGESTKVTLLRDGKELTFDIVF